MKLPSLTRISGAKHKGERGRVLVVAGSPGMSGAALLCGWGAMKSGVGLLTLAVPESICSVVAAAHPSYMTLPLADIAASFQWAVVEVLVEKTVQAARETGVASLAVTGGVGANLCLRESLEAACKTHGWEAAFPPPRYCTDNAVMIAAEGCRLFDLGEHAEANVDVSPRGVFS